MNRPGKHYTFLKMAEILAEQATCSRRQVGCILTNVQGHIIGSGYNGNAYGLDHCIDTPCTGATMRSGEGLDVCEAIHAEQNALMQCRNINEIYNVYVTTAPCMHCTKMLLNTPCRSVYYANKYQGWEKCHELFQASGRNFIHITLDEDGV